MRRTSIVKTGLEILIGALLPAIAWGGTGAPCSLEHASASGPNVWLLCDQKILYTSADGGVTWQARTLPPEARLKIVVTSDGRRGFAAGERGALLATEDGAVTWRPIALPAQENMTSLHWAGDEMWLAGWTGTILHSADGGKTWELQPSGVLQGLESIYFADSRNGWAVGWAGVILRTSDGGKHWEQVATKAMWSLSGVVFRDANNGWAVGFGGQILRSKDGGKTWTEQTSPANSWLTSLAFDRAGHGWITTDNQLLLSEDGGETWKSIPLDVMLFLSQLVPVKDELWAVGQFGVLKLSGTAPNFTALATLPESRDADPGSGS